MNLDYKVLKKLITRSARVKKNSVSFSINYDRIMEGAKELDLTAILFDPASRPIEIADIPLLSEYFKNNLSWITSDKEFLMILFIKSEDIDERCQELLDAVGDENSDVVNALATIIAEYPCYTAAVVSFTSTDIDRGGKTFFEIRCRANAVRIKQSDYKYRGRGKNEVESESTVEKELNETTEEVDDSSVDEVNSTEEE